MNPRKPFAGEPGYVCSLRAQFGHVVVFDRENGAQLGPEGSRWVVAAYNGERTPLATVPCRSQSAARTTMKEARARGYGWLAPLIQRTDERNVALVDDAPPAVVPTEPAQPDNESYMRGWNAVEERFAQRRKRV